MAGTAFHMSYCVRSSLEKLMRSRAKMSYFSEGGRLLTRKEAIDKLMDELAKGRETLPCDGKCGNPCKRDARCKGFDYGKEGGCPGHPCDDGFAPQETNPEDSRHG